MNQALRPQMAETRHNISSIMGFISAFSAHPAYSASKRAAQISMKAARLRATDRRASGSTSMGGSHGAAWWSGIA